MITLSDIIDYYMRNIVLAIQIVVSIVLSALILIQSKGSGLGRTFGGGMGTSFSRRGLEKLLYKLTFVFAGLFILISIVSLSI